MTSLYTARKMMMMYRVEMDAEQVSNKLINEYLLVSIIQLRRERAFHHLLDIVLLIKIYIMIT